MINKNPTAFAMGSVTGTECRGRFIEFFHTLSSGAAMRQNTVKGSNYRRIFDPQLAARR